MHRDSYLEVSTQVDKEEVDDDPMYNVMSIERCKTGYKGS
jgi:hypothetical protein